MTFAVLLAHFKLTVFTFMEHERHEKIFFFSFFFFFFSFFLGGGGRGASEFKCLNDNEKEILYLYFLYG